MALIASERNGQISSNRLACRCRGAINLIENTSIEIVEHPVCSEVRTSLGLSAFSFDFALGSLQKLSKTSGETTIVPD